MAEARQNHRKKEKNANKSRPKKKETIEAQTQSGRGRKKERPAVDPKIPEKKGIVIRQKKEIGRE